MNRILLADPNPTLRSALALLLETRLDVQIVGQVSSMESLLCEAKATQPDLIVVSRSLPGELFEERMAELHSRVPRASILISSLRNEKTDLEKEPLATIFQTDLPETILNTIREHLAHHQKEGLTHV